MPMSIAFFDDHPVFLDGLKQVFGRSAEYEIVATGNSPDDAVEAGKRLRPTIILLDLAMAGNVLEAIQKITASSPSTKVIMLTSLSGVEGAVRSIESGASGYVLKSSSSDELKAAITNVLAGETFVTPSFATKVIVSLRQAAMREKASKAVKFSVREDQILTLLQRGWTNREIASQLTLSEKTVKHYMTVLMQKLNARNRLEVLIAARNFPSAGEMRMASASH